MHNRPAEQVTARHLMARLGIDVPIIQAPMAGTSTPQLAAAVSNAGALGSIGVGAMSVAAARAAIRDLRGQTARSFNVNLFTHAPAQADPAREQRWLQHLQPHFAKFNAAPPTALREIYTSFRADPAMLAMLLMEQPPVISFHFGLPDAPALAALKAAGSYLLASATSLAEGVAAQRAGIDAVVAQGIEAGGHRGVFDPEAADAALGTSDLVRLLVRELTLPVIAAGGIMDGADIAAMLALGASAAQMGTAFIASPESAADAGYRAAVLAPDAETEMTRAISGRPARGLVNQFTILGRQVPAETIAAYPIAYDAGKALNAAATAAGDTGYGAHWAGTGVRRARALPAADLVRRLRAELIEARRAPA